MGEGEKLKVLLIAFQCAPEGGSVSMIGWHWVHYLNPHVDLHLITHIRHQRELEPVLPPSVKVSYIDTEWFSAPLFRLATILWNRSQHLLFMVSNIDFLLFGHKAMRYLRSLRPAENFDLVHVVTPVTPVAPHRFGRLGLPTLLGPLNGGLPLLKGFPEIGTEERAWLYRIRILARLLSRLYGTFRDANLIFSASACNDRELGPKLAAKAYRMCENGVLEVADQQPTFPLLPPEGPLKLLFVGRLIPVKGLPMLLEAMRGLDGLHLTIVGDGPQEAFLKKLVEDHQLSDRVSFLGYVRPTDLTELYRACHLNVLPSVRESGGATILEAMAQGRPSLALDQGGPSEYITPECGLLLPCESTSQVIADLKKTLIQLQADPSPLPAMATASLERARTHYTWSAKAAEILEVYRQYAKKRG
jgi:glycosyltransferase involved in cell wall biosynthesis